MYFSMFEDYDLGQCCLVEIQCMAHMKIFNFLVARLEGINKKENFNNFQLAMSKMLSFQHVIPIQNFIVILYIIFFFGSFSKSGADFILTAQLNSTQTSPISRVHESPVVSGSGTGQQSSSREKAFTHHPRLRKTAKK